MPTFRTTCFFGIIGDHEVTVDYDYTPEQPGKTYGPPEDCYPPLAEEITINSAMVLFPFYSDPLDIRELVEDDDLLLQQISDHEADEAKAQREEYEAEREFDHD